MREGKLGWLLPQGNSSSQRNNILELMSMIDMKLQLKKKTTALEQQQQNKKSSNQQSNRKFTNGESKGEQQKNPCLKHDRAHEYKDCPDHKNSQSKPSSESGKEKAIEKDFHSTEAIDSTIKKLIPNLVKSSHTLPSHFSMFETFSFW
jgi:hypothetical protein